MADEKDVVVEFLKSKSSSKSKFYFKDFTDLFPDKGPREVKKILTKLVNVSSSFSLTQHCLSVSLFFLSEIKSP